MAEMLLMKGNEAIAEAAIQAGCRYYFGYPITPQNELGEYMARRLPEEGGVFLQAESEVAAINMVHGAAGAGARVMTSSSSPGVALMQEGISYIAGAELPCVLVNMMRGGPGLGGIQPSQSDYFQSTKGGGNGDYRLIVFGPSSIQEMIDLTMEAFEIAEKYSNPVMILGDGLLGQMMESVQFNPIEQGKYAAERAAKATTGAKGRERNIITTLHLKPEELEAHNNKLQQKYQIIEENEARYELVECDDAEIILVAYGTTSRVVQSAIDKARADGIKVGMIRPITLWPFPYKAFDAVKEAKTYLCVEMSSGQMVEDVKLAVPGKNVCFYGRTGGVVPTTEEIYAEIRKLNEGVE